MPRPHSAALHGTRAELIQLLRRGPMTVSDMATQLGLTDNAVRLHLSVLERDGFVHMEGVRRGAPGKPATLYAVNSRLDATLSQAMEPVLDAMMTVIESREEARTLRATLRATGREMASRLPMPDGSLADRAAKAIDAVQQLGGDAILESTESGLVLQGHGCPLSAVVARHPEACLVLEAFLGEFVDADVRTSCVRGERPRCRFELRERAIARRART